MLATVQNALRPWLRAGLRTLRRMRLTPTARPYRPPDWSRLPEEGVKGPRHRHLAAAHCAYGTLALRTDHPLSAQKAFERAVRADPSRARAWQGLGESLLSGGRLSPTRVDGLGVSRTRIGDPDAAKTAFERLTTLEPRKAFSWVALGRAQLRSGELDAAEASLRHATELDPGSSDAPFWQARLLETRARLRGAHTHEEASSLIDAWQRTLDIDPDRRSARYHLVRAQISIGDFAGARASTGAPVGNADPPGADALAGLVWDPRTPDDLFLVEHARLLEEGRFTDAYRVKDLLAARIASAGINWTTPVPALLDVARALAYQGRTDEALAALSEGRRVWMTRDERLTIDKLAADISLGVGDPVPLIDFARRLSDRAVNAGPERRFDGLVRHRQVAVIGPADLGPEAVAAATRHADTVVSTKHPVVGAHRTVTYLSDSTAMLRSREPAASDGDVTVVRPSLAPLARLAGLQGADVRVMPAEDSTTFFATHFGIQRILYDLIQYEPASIELAAVDFFLGDRPYRDGYNEELADVFEPRRLQPALSLSVHDYRADFQLTKRLRDAGVVSASPEVARCLDLDVDAYLRRLEANRGGLSVSRSGLTPR